jgi:hypothetical protein
LTCAKSKWGAKPDGIATCATAAAARAFACRGTRFVAHEAIGSDSQPRSGRMSEDIVIDRVIHDRPQSL